MTKEHTSKDMKQRTKKTIINNLLQQSLHQKKAKANSINPTRHIRFLGQYNRMANSLQTDT